MVAYSERSLRDWLLESELPDWGDFADAACEYFPAEVVRRFGDLIPEHPLRRELVATIVANRVVNSEGVTFVTRLMAETGLAEGRLRCVVCTSSLDLGVDFSPVDQVIQVGSPKGVARLLQRAGRSGHRPGAPSEVICVPTHAFELVEIAAARRAAETGRIEAREPLTGCLDVLAQQVVAMCCDRDRSVDSLYRLARRADPYRELSMDALLSVLDMLSEDVISFLDAAWVEPQKVAAVGAGLQ